MRLDLNNSGKVRLSLPSKGLFPLAGTLAISFQPLGSFASLLLFGVVVSLMAIMERVPAKPMGNWLVILGVYFLILMGTWVFRPENILLFGMYATYLTLVIIFGLITFRIVRSMSDGDRQKTINWILGLDLLLNLPAVLIELITKGAGDPIQGIAGLITSGNFSQGRTNAIRAGMFLSLALFAYSQRKSKLSLSSAGFNAIVLVIGTSMTTLLSAFGAGALALFLTAQKHRIIKLSAICLLAWAGLWMNSALYGIGKADYFLALGYHFNFTPKFNFYLHLMDVLFPERPISIFLGNGLGNFMNRFAVLLNFENYSSFPFKRQMMDLAFTSDTREHLLNLYNMETRVEGNSILGTPWSSNLAVILEAGLLGIGLILALLGRTLLQIASKGRNVIGSGVFLIGFIFFNMLFDVYLDFPEVICLFFLIASVFASTDGRNGVALPTSPATVV